MSVDRIARLSPKRLALLAMDLEARLASGPARASIAVVGIGCRLPGGVHGPDDFWTLLQEGRDAISEVPPDRWPLAGYYDANPDAPHRMSTRFGGFLDDIRGFDADFFGISPREAAAMDPQQRIFLEVAWEALEHAGINPDRLKGTDTGVFAGVCNTDYYQRLSRAGASTHDAYVATGNASSVVSGRVAYVLNLQGPAVSIDTACSSSLVAVHQACQSLRLHETRLALAGGVNVICAPNTTVLLSKAHMMAPDGRCKTFDRRADGFVRAEGCAIVVLKRLADAVADGDRILALIRGSATNQDGRSSGLTAPSGPSQESVIRHALAAAGVDPHEVGYVEAHGTGTALGDPIEVRALSAALASGRDDRRPLTIGSVKTNIGHLESAAGVAGLIKAVLVLSNRVIPAHLHLQERNPHIDWSAPIAIPCESMPWPDGFERRIAGVSSFGFSGTNAHVVLEAAPELEDVPVDRGTGRRLLALSARSEAALEELVRRFDATLSQTPPERVDDVCRTANEGRAQLPCRLAVTGTTAAQLREGLARPRARAAAAQARPASSASGAPDVVLLFPGQGSQYAGMGRDLYGAQPEFRAAFDDCARLMEPELSMPLRELLLDDARLHETAMAQPALFAVEYACARMWLAWGVQPAAVLGHSLGEIAAACISGILTLDDAARLVVARGRLMQQLPAGGRMAAVFADERSVRERLVGETTLAVAAVNASDETVVSGDGVALARWCAARTDEGIESRMLRSAHAFHSPLVEPILDALQDASATMRLSPPRVPLLSNLTGRPLEPGALDDLYWRAHAREPVRFADALSHLDTARRCVFLEVGPGTTLLSLVRRAAPMPGAMHLATMRTGRDQRDVCLESLAALWTAGVSIDWRRVGGAGGAGRRVTLPGYPFQRQPHWLDEGETAPASPAATGAGTSWLPGRRLATALPVFEAELTLDRLAHVPVHVVAGRRMVAASFFVEAALEAARAVRGQRPGVLAELELIAPLSADALPRGLQTVVGSNLVEIFSAAPEATDWTLHARGRLGAVAATGAGTPEAPDVVRARCPAEWTGDDLRARLAARDIDAGSAADRLARLWRRDGEAIARLDVDDTATRWHAALLDAAISIIAAAVPDVSERRVIASLGEVEVGDAPAGPMWVHAIVEPTANDLVAHLRVSDDSGRVRLLIRHVRLAALAGTGVEGARPPAYAVVWREQPLPDGAGPPAEIPDDEFGRLSRQHGLDRYVELKPTLDALATDYARNALGDLGALDREGRPDPTRLDEARAQVAAPQRPLFEHLTGWLAQGPTSPRGDAAAAQARAGEAFPQFAAELQLLGRCGPRLADALRGAADPMDLLFGDPDLLPRLYRAAPSARCFNALLAAQVARQCRAVSGRPMRILEVGAGTGGTTAALIPHLDAATTRYVFSDVSPAFLARARREFAAYPFVEYRLFDAERSGCVQGLAPHSFDIVVAANALHATADLRASLTNIAELLVPGGRLVLLEGTSEQRWVDITFGLTEGWWRCVGRDPLRRYPLIAAEAWRGLLNELGMDSVELSPDLAATAGTGQRVITASAAGVTALARPWIVVSDADPLAAELVAEVARRGDTGVRVDSIEDPSLDRVPAQDDVRVVVLEPARPLEPVSAAVDACARLVAVLRRTRERWPSATVWAVTRGAQPVEPGDPVRPDHAALWGLGAVAALEHADAWGGLVDLDPKGGPAGEGAAVVAEVLDRREDRVAYRRGRRFVPRLKAQPLSSPASEVLDVSGSWLITGGFGAVGLCCAEWLANRGVRHLVLLGRSGPPAESGRDARPSRQILDALLTRGVRVELCSGDVSDAAGMARLMAGFGTRWPLLAGVVHTASLFDSRDLVTLGAGDFRSMFAAKAAGAWNVIQHLPGSTTHVVFCSSTAAILGGIGQGAYAAANAVLDALAYWPGLTSVRAISVNWGLWQAMRGVSDDLRRQYAAIGFNEMAPHTALDAMHDAIASGTPQCCIAAIDWRRFRDARLARRRQPLLSEIDVAPPPAAPCQPAPLSTVLERSDPGERHAVVLDCVRRHIAAILQLRSVDAVPVDRGLFELGMDSLMSIELRQRLEGELGTPLALTLTFNYPTAGALAAHLLAQRVPVDAGAPLQATAAAGSAVTAPLEYRDGLTH